MSIILAIKGKEIKRIDTSLGYLTVLFDDDGSCGLHIFNNYTIDMESVQDSVGKTVQDVVMTDDHWRLIFADGTFLQIGMRDCDYNGPESVTYFAGGNFYVNQ